MILSFALFFLNSKGCVPLSSLWSAIAPKERGPHAGVAVAAEGFPLMADLEHWAAPGHPLFSTENSNDQKLP